MPFDPHRAAIRFGTGLSPVLPPPASGAAMLAALAGPDRMAEAIPIALYATASPSLGQLQAASRARRDEAGDPAAAVAELERLRGEAGRLRMANLRATLARQVAAADGLRERLTAFWASHFTVRERNAFGAHLVTPYVEEAIRPHVAGRFGAMLTAVTTHPMMLLYLDGARSVGPGSPAGRNGGGLNENHARELLELHALGPQGPYGQGDVRELAELLTGLRLDAEGAMEFAPRRAEPGAETVLGVTYPEAGPESVRAALADLAVHPATAAHLARKMAAHFVADEPDAALVEAMAVAWRGTDGDLLAVTGAMLGHPAAWEPRKAKVKPPVAFVTSSLRALGVPGSQVAAMGDRETRRTFANPLGVMGQPWERPDGPDGWPEAAEAWVTPQFMAGRIDWAMNRPEELVPMLLDPRDFVGVALGPDAEPEVTFAASAAERVSEGIGAVLASADFQRR